MGMKKLFRVEMAVIALVSALALTGCLSVTYKMGDGIIPVDYFQTVKNEDERLLYVAPVLAPNHQFSLLYIITNPEDILNARDKFGDPGILPFRDVENALREFSPIKIQSGATNMKMGDGMAIFSVPPVVEEFFYVYIRYRSDIKYKSDYSTEVSCGILPLPPGQQAVLIGFSEGEGGMGVFAVTDPAEIKTIYDNSTGLYGWYLSKNKEQTGYLTAGFKERYAILNQQAKEKALAAGARFEVRSSYFTYHQETREYADFVPARHEWQQGETTEFYDAQGRQIGEARTRGKMVQTAAAHEETRTRTVNVPVRHELAFELYKGDVKVYSGMDFTP
jgi:hypothetical protein